MKKIFKKIFIGLVFILVIWTKPISAKGDFISEFSIESSVEIGNSLSEKTLDLTVREKSPNINQGFTDNILLAIHYLNGEKFNRKGVEWNKIREPLTVTFVLQPGESFAFHRNTLPGFNDPKVSIDSKFIVGEGYKSVAGLGGNGVCHLASLINWTAQEAGLEVISPVNHNFFPIAGIPQEFGTSIHSASPSQNLYIRNNQPKPVTFAFKSDSSRVSLTIEKEASTIIYQ